MTDHQFICWREVSQPISSRRDLCRQILAGENLSAVLRLPVAEIRETCVRHFSKYELLESAQNQVRFSCGGEIHCIEINDYYFSYDRIKDADVFKGSQIASFIICDLPEIAGRYGCVMYSASTDKAILNPVGSVVREEVALRLQPVHIDGSIPSVCFQLPQLDFVVNAQTALDVIVAIMDISPEALELKSGVQFEEGISDLGDCKSALLRINDQICYLENTLPSYQTLVVVSVANKNPGALVDDLLQCLGLTSSSLAHVDESVKLLEHELWRQDDNGNQVLIETTCCLADAIYKVNEFTARGHRQLYWARLCHISQ